MAALPAQGFLWNFQWSGDCSGRCRRLPRRTDFPANAPPACPASRAGANGVGLALWNMGAGGPEARSSEMRGSRPSCRPSAGHSGGSPFACCAFPLSPPGLAVRYGAPLDCSGRGAHGRGDQVSPLVLLADVLEFIAAWVPFLHTSDTTASLADTAAALREASKTLPRSADTAVLLMPYMIASPFAVIVPVRYILRGRSLARPPRRDMGARRMGATLPQDPVNHCWISARAR
jgi:hypothetical protein